MSHNEQKNKHKISNTNLRSLCHHQNHQLRTGLEMKLPFLPPRHATRFWFQNCNGLITANDNLKFQHEIQTYVEKGIHFISLAETRLNISHTLTNYQIEQSMQQLIPTSKAILHNTPGYSSTSAYQPGGVATFFMDGCSNATSPQHEIDMVDGLLRCSKAQNIPSESILSIELIQKTARQIFLHGCNRNAHYKQQTSMVIPANKLLST